MPEEIREPEIHTFGCRLNAFESEVMLAKAKEAGLAGVKDGAILFNTCAVTSESVRQAKQAIRRERRHNPHSRIIVSGCAAQTEPEAFSAMEEVDLVIGNEEKLHAASYRALPEFGVNDPDRVRVGDIMQLVTHKPHKIRSLGGHTRAFIQVQNGCNHRCTFCVIPYGRGNSRSAPVHSVIDQVRTLVENGYKEVVLTGVDTTSWGADLTQPRRLGDLVKAILDAVPALPRLRLSSIDSIEADPVLVDVIATQERFMPHLHLSLQHGDDLILKRMKRRHLRKDAIEFCRTIRRLRPEVSLSADMIAGFPTETDEMFKSSIALVDECGLDFLHVFPFSPRPGTPAARMPQLDRAIVKQRADQLRQKGDEAHRRHLEKMKGGTYRVLVEKGGFGRLPQFTLVRTGSLDRGEIFEMEISGHDGKHLTGSAANLAKAD